MRRLPPALRPGPSGLAAAMLVAGHALTYVLVAPSPSARERLLASTGHGYWRTAVLAAFVFGIYAAGRSVILGARRLAMPAPVPFVAFARRFAALGCAAFVGLEIGERLAAGAPLGDLMARGIVPIGVLIQLGLAVIAAAFLRLLYRAGAAAALQARAAAPPRSRAVSGRPVIAPFVPVAVADGAWGTRGPPHR